MVGIVGAAFNFGCGAKGVGALEKCAEGAEVVVCGFADRQFGGDFTGDLFVDASGF